MGILLKPGCSFVLVTIVFVNVHARWERDGVENEKAVTRHKHGPACIELAEALERDIGTFDDPERSETDKHSILDRIIELLQQKTNKKSNKFKDVALKHWEDKSKPFGAYDLC